MTSTSPSAGGSNEQEFVVRIPARNERKTYHMMKFNQSLNVDTAKWSQVRMVRENNRKEFVREEDEIPKFGAGSEFGRQEKEEARRKKFGITTKRYNPDNQPWLIRVGSKKEGKQYKGIREGGISDNTAYYVFTHAQDGSFEAHPVKEWYNFTPRVTYRTLNAEEAEEKFAERGKILNHFALMVNRKLRPNQDDVDEDEDGKKSKGGGSKKDFKVSDMDDWVDSADELDSDSDDDGGKKKKKGSDDSDDEKKNSRSKDSKKKAGGKKKKKKDDSDEESEAGEDSDDGDDEGREVDYMSDESSDSEEEMLAEADVKGVDQDKALAAMLDSESSSDEEDADKKKDEEEDKPEEEGKKGKKKEGGKDEKNGKRSTKSSANNSRSTTPTPADGNDKTDGTSAADEKAARAEKRKAIVDNVMDINSDLPAAKKMRNEPFSSSSAPPPPPANSVEAAFEEDVRRYLMRKPITTTELLKKFKSKKTGISKDELMPVLANVLKRVNPNKQKIKGIMYLSLKAENK